MLRITCPVCGLAADETEFQAGGEAHVARPASAAPDAVSDEAQRDYLYIRQNPRGLAHELWLCARGCGKWFHAARDTYTLEFRHFYRISDPVPGGGPDPGGGPQATSGATAEPAAAAKSDADTGTAPAAKPEEAAKPGGAARASGAAAKSGTSAKSGAAARSGAPKSAAAKPRAARKAPARRKAEKP